MAGGVGLGQFFAALAVLMQLKERGWAEESPMGPYQHFVMGGELQDVHFLLVPASKIIIPSRNSLRGSKKKE